MVVVVTNSLSLIPKNYSPEANASPAAWDASPGMPVDLRKRTAFEM